jgi:large subunit ribosomal protein L10
MVAHVSEQKKKNVDILVKLITEYPIIGAIDLEGMPTAQLQKMRATLRENDIVLLVSKRRLMRLALEKAKTAKKGVEELENYLQGMPAFIFSKLNSFKLYKLLKSSKSEAPAKAGQIAPKDIEVKSGATPFAPGPIISELAGVGIKSGVEDGKVAIKEDCIVAKEGDVISPELAGLLTRLDIKPMEIGLNLVASFDNGTIFKKSVLDVDEDKLLADITSAAQESFNLSVEAGYFTKDNVDVILQNVFYSCKALAEESGFLADVVVEDMLSTAESSAKSVQAEAKIPEAVKEEPKAEEKPAEEPKEEPKPAEQPSESQPQETKEEQKEEKALEEEKEIIKEETKLEEKPKEEQAPVEKEVQEAVKEIEEKQLESERIDKEKEVEKIEKEKEPETEDKIAKMVEQQKKHASGEDKKESAEALIEEVKADDSNEKEKKEIEEVENLVSQLKKGEPLKPQSDNDEVPSLSELAKRNK